MADYETIRQDCLKNKWLWEDKDFPASWRSLRVPGDYGIVWKRPAEIAKGQEPKYIVKDAAYFDINQGDLGNCWFLASAISVTACKPQLMDRVAFFDQSFEKGKYAGIFRFRFWQYGNWKEVLIDDRLPTKDGKLVFAENRQEPNEFWGPLLEKAYAKLMGSYGQMVGGIVSDALVDLTGGITERIELKDKAPKLDAVAKIILDGVKTNTLMGGAIWSTVGGGRETRMKNGLYQAHAYGIIGAEQVTVNGSKVNILHIRNPHGLGEWNGAWSDQSAEWNKLSDGDRARVPRVDNDNGDFWMSLEDFVKNFDELQMCHLSPDGMTNQLAEEEGKAAWQMTEYWGEWVRGVTAGGMATSFTSKMYWKNPQFKVNLEKAMGSSVTMVVSLMREPVHSDMTISFNVFKLREGRQPDKIDADNFYEFSPRLVQTSGGFTLYREVGRSYDMEPGTYVIVPCARQQGQEAKFYLRVFSEVLPDVEPVVNPVGPTNRENFHIETDRIGQLFEKISHQGTMDSFGFRDLLSQMMEEEYGNKLGVTMETTRSLLTYMDPEMSGLVDVSKVRAAWDVVKLCVRGFATYDRNNSGTIDVSELEEVFKRVGFSVNANVLKAVVRRYGNREGEIMQDDFLQCFFRILTLYEKFRKKEESGKLSLDLDEWLVEALYA